MSRVTATFATQEEAESAKTRLLDVGVQEHDIQITSGDADRGEQYVVTAEVPPSHLVEAEEVIREGDHERSEEHSEGQAIAPGGRPAEAVGATSTIGIADDGNQTYSDPLEPRDR